MWTLCAAWGAGGGLAAAGLHAQTAVLDPVQVVATRGAPSPDQVAVATQLFDPERLDAFPAITLDDALRDDASFSLFRRTDSLISNPTSQGVSLREIGPSGASRSLVLFDGVPLNDPFGGWVVWTGVPRLSLVSASIVQGGGSGVWGNAALAGAIELVSDPFAASGLARGAATRAGAGILQADAGAFDTYSGEVLAAAPAGPASVAVDARSFSTSGFYDLLPADRGSVDRPFDSHHELAQLTAKDQLAPAVQAEVTGTWFNEARGNGTALQNNASHSATAALTLDGTPSPGFAWSLQSYAEDEGFAAMFSSVAANRDSETPADDQFAVPASAAGAALTAEWSEPGGALTRFGADFRHVAGETREDYDYAGGAFGRERWAGGAENFGGVFLSEDAPLGSAWRVSGALRADRWELADGHDWEYELTPAGGPGSLTAYPERTGDELSPDAGLIWNASSFLRLRAAAYRGFRVPTLNEYYRPFRVGNVSTLANPTLRPESLDGGEIGAEYHRGPWEASVTGFADGLYQAVGTITESSTPTLVTEERANLNSVRVAGAEASASWRPSDAFRLRGGYLYNDSRVIEADAEPNLQGLRLQEVPRNTVTGSAEWTGPGQVRLSARVRWVSLEFDDPNNTLRLPAATVVDLDLSRRFGRRLELYAAAENLLDARVATSLSTAGLFTYDAPLLIRIGGRFGW